MLINAFNRANDAQLKELQKWCSGEKFDRKEKVAAVTHLYDEIGIRQLCEAKIEYYFEESKKWLDKVSVPEERKAHLRAYEECIPYHGIDDSRTVVACAEL